MIIGAQLARLWGLGRQDLPEDDLVEPTAYRGWKRLWQSIPHVGNDPDLFERLDTIEWDLIILLDACRYDVLASIADDAVVTRVRSPASATPEFLSAADKTGIFDGTTYVSGNPQSGEHSPGEVDHVPVYEERWDEDLATVPPDPIYDIAEDYIQEGNRVIAHTLQPHYPHLSCPGDQTAPVPGGLHPRYFDNRFHNENLQALLANGFLDLKTARRSYKKSVKFAWQKASHFAAGLADDGYRVVVTADHGELFGEWGFVEHPMGVPVPSLVNVPWIVFEPRPTSETPKNVNDRLAALGYKE